jgi:hypothetical protein
MGGSSSKKKDNKSSNVTMPTDTVQPSMPGQLDAISQQLAAGYGQAPSDVLAQLMQYYAPMQLPDYSPQSSGAPTPTPAPTPSSSGYGGGGGIIGGRGMFSASPGRRY